MDEATFKRRTKQLGLDVIKLVESLPRSRSADVIGSQLLRSAISVGANYRAACRGTSKPGVLAKLAIVEEEADETGFWIELLVDSGIVPAAQLNALLTETNEILAMIVASIKTLRRQTFEANLGSTIRRGAPGNPKSKIQN
jgi:four helix bundle protein